MKETAPPNHWKVHQSRVLCVREGAAAWQEAFRIDEELAHAAKEKMVQLSRAREEQLNAYKARLLAER